MAKQETIHPWQQIEEQAFHGFREWPLWLVLRQRELAQQSAHAQPATDAPPAADTGQSVENPNSNS